MEVEVEEMNTLQMMMERNEVEVQMKTALLECVVLVSM